MKKTILALGTCLALQVGIAAAAPINDLASQQTAVGIGSEGFYAEHKLTDSFTLGFETADYAYDAKDVYGQFALSNNLRGIVGNRDFDGADSKMYFGLAVDGPISPSANGYASFVTSSEFDELQLGANFPVANNVDLNLGYHSFMPDFGNDKDGLNIGATLKF